MQNHILWLSLAIMLSSSSTAIAADPKSKPMSPPLPAAQLQTADAALVDGKVYGLNADTYDEYHRLEEASRGKLFSEAQAEMLGAVMLQDKEIDEVEADLLRELTQGRFRSITVTKAGSSSEKTVTYPTSGNTKRILARILNPPVDLNKAWHLGISGWNDMIRAYNETAVEQTRVANFLVERFGEDWAVSNINNGYKPLRDRIGKLYGYSNSKGGDVAKGKALLYFALNQLDKRETDEIPDFLYSWLEPAGLR